MYMLCGFYRNEPTSTSIALIIRSCGPEAGLRVPRRRSTSTSRILTAVYSTQKCLLITITEPPSLHPPLIGNASEVEYASRQHYVLYYHITSRTWEFRKFGSIFLETVENSGCTRQGLRHISPRRLFTIVWSLYTRPKH